MPCNYHNVPLDPVTALCPVCAAFPAARVKQEALNASFRCESGNNGDPCGLQSCGKCYVGDEPDPMTEAKDMRVDTHRFIM